MPSSAERIVDLVERLLGAPLPLRVRAWDGSEAGPGGGPVLVVNSRRALRRLVRSPDEVGLGRAWVAGEIDIDGDLEAGLRTLQSIGRDLAVRRKLSPREQAELFRRGVTLGAIGREPAPPPEEVALTGSKHSQDRDRQAISHHYDVGNDFYRVVLGSSMVYSCAYWAQPADDTYGLDRGATGQARAGLPQARSAAGHAGARRRVRLGVVRHPRRSGARRASRWHHAQ